MKKNLISFSLSCLALSALSSCGGSSGSSSKRTPFTAPPQNEEAREEEIAETDGYYMAKFTTLNPQVNGTIPGSFTFTRSEDKMMVYLRLFAGGPKVWHQQAVYKGTRCPTAADDLNGDGFIDVVEGQKVWGEMIIPLDANINTQRDGRNFYPVADLSGYYHYERLGSFKKLVEDLQKEDTDPNDNVAKLGPDERFSLVGRVVVVHGVAQTVALPETVGTLARRKPFQNLPITCGVITNSTEEPGAYDTEEIPGPIADVQEGQDQPAGDDWETPTGTPGTPAPGGTNESETGETPTEEGENP